MGFESEIVQNLYSNSLLKYLDFAILTAWNMTELKFLKIKNY